MNILDSLFKLWEILIDNKVSIFFWNDSISKLSDSKLGNEPWECDGEASRNQSSKSNVVNMREISIVKNFSPVINWFVIEHGHEILRNL